MHHKILKEEVPLAWSPTQSGQKGCCNSTDRAPSAGEASATQNHIQNRGRQGLGHQQELSLGSKYK